MPIPPNRVVEPFPERIDGVFGRFRTNESYEVNYMLCCLDVEEIRRLSTAEEAIEFASIGFEDLIQRDVDYERVDEKIIKEYLENGSGRVLFFPPIIVSVIAQEDDRLKDSYDLVERKVEEKAHGNQVEIIFDKDKFGVELPIIPESSLGHSIDVGDLTYYYNPAWATFKYNSRRVKLIVIDGQHRFQALTRLAEKRKEILKEVELPICIVFTPAADNSNNSHETIMRDLREMFVTINTTAKEVSGHFIDLLKDKSLASMAVRDLANFWKQSNIDPCYSKLQQLEWNERRDNRANTVQRNYTVTTVSILANALRANAFDSADNGLQSQLLNLQDIESELATGADAVQAFSIAEDKFHPSQERFLKTQIRDLITPALDILFTKPRPYKKVRDNFEEAVKAVDKQILEGKSDAATFKETILARFRRCTDRDPNSIKNFEENEFDPLIPSKEDDRVYFLNVFQQALVRVWADLAAGLAKNFSIPPSTTAEILSDSLNNFAFHPESKIFEKNLPYTNLILYSGSRVLLAQYAKDGWKNLLQASLLKGSSRQSIEESIKNRYASNSEEIIEMILNASKASLIDYINELYSRIVDAIKKDWSNRPYQRGLKDKLEKLYREDLEKFSIEVEALAHQEHREALEKLGNRLDLNLAEFNG